MGQSMKDIKRRIKSVTSTRKITKAMELVSSAKLRKARNQLEQSRPYYETIIHSIQGILRDSQGIHHPMLENRKVKNTLYVVVTADRGLCGGYNTNVLKMVEADIQSKETAKIMTLGQKGKSYFEKRDYDILYQMSNISETPSYLEAKEIAKNVIESFEKGAVDEVKVAFTHFASNISFEPTLKRILPAEDIGQESQEKRKAIIEYEPSPEEVLAYLIPKFIESTVYGALIESSASEQASRRNAMESATDNADELIETLKLAYNRARQDSITQEITEIVGGAEALS